MTTVHAREAALEAGLAVDLAVTAHARKKVQGQSLCSEFAALLFQGMVVFSNLNHRLFVAVWRCSDHTFRLLLVGDSGIGKSALLTRFAAETFNPEYTATVGVETVSIINSICSSSFT